MEDWHQHGQSLIHTTENPVNVLTSLRENFVADDRHAHFNRPTDSCIVTLVCFGA